MARKSKEELQELMSKENVDRIWSWSRINCFHTSPYEYMLKYVKQIPEDRNDCIYTTTGTIAHDILEKLYTNQIKYDDMIGRFEDAWLIAYNISQLKFDRNNEENNKKIGDKYYKNLEHFFTNHTVIKYKPVIEQFVKFKIGDNLFTGYIDCCFKDDDGNYNIIDFKTSSIYKGVKAENESGQLVCYAIALNQMGIPFDRIHIAWNFLKYCTIQYEQANGVIKTKDTERCKLGEAIQSNVKIWLKKFGYENEIDKYLKDLLDINDIKCLPKEIQEKYIISDCYVYIPLTQNLIDKWINEIIKDIEDIKFREKEYSINNNDKIWWDNEESVKTQSYYFSTLCSYSSNLHLPYKEYLNKIENQKNDIDFFNGIGCNNSEPYSTSNVIHNNKDNIDLSWLNSI